MPPRLGAYVNEEGTVGDTNHHLLLIDDNPRHAKALEAAVITTGADVSAFEWARTLSSGLEEWLVTQRGQSFSIFPYPTAVV